jgi:hypothetical protein
MVNVDALADNNTRVHHDAESVVMQSQVSTERWFGRQDRVKNERVEVGEQPRTATPSSGVQPVGAALDSEGHIGHATRTLEES